MIRNCKRCGKEFNAKGKGIYCSCECAKIAKREYNAAWHKAHPIDYRTREAVRKEKDIQRRAEARRAFQDEVNALNKQGISWGKAHAPKVEVIIPAWAK